MTLFLLVGCGETRRGIMDSLIFSGEDPWLDRDTVSDPQELVNGECCNDFLPYAMAIDTTLYAAIEPQDDLDYYNIQITGSYAGQVFFFPSDLQDKVNFRIFTRQLEEYEEVYLDSATTANGEPLVWTTLYGTDKTFTVLLGGLSGKAEGSYTIRWARVIPTTYLTIHAPTTGAMHQRGREYTIKWEHSRNEPVSFALMKGPVLVRSLKRGYDRQMSEIMWIPAEDLEPGDDYRIMVYQSHNPTALDITDVFTID